MLNRRILRIKAFKVLYSYAENPQMSLKDAEAQLEMSCTSVRDLYLFMLSIIPAVTNVAKARIEAARNKFNPTREELNPNMRFVENSISRILLGDIDFQKIIGKTKLSWDQYDVLLRKLYDDMLTRQWFIGYMSKETVSPADEAAMFTKMFEEEFVDNADLESILEEISIWWNDDLAYALTWCCKTVSGLAAGERWALPALYLSDIQKKPASESDKAFVYNLLRAAYTGLGRYSEMISGTVPQWDRERLFTIDTMLIVCGLAEAQTFPEIPIKVTINEYVEISKFYSTPKSRSFVNGILDRLIQQMVNDGKIVKSGKGLL